MTGGRTVWRAAGMKTDCENGQIDVEERWVGGVSHGTGTRWLAGEGEGWVGIRCSKSSDGTLMGVFREWQVNGRLARETPLVAGGPHVEATSGDTAGKLIDTGQVSR